jgi:PAS domain-containing protein
MAHNPAFQESVESKHHFESHQTFPGSASVAASDANLFAVTLNSDGEIIYCNGHFLNLIGLSLDEVLGRPLNELFAALD